MTAQAEQATKFTFGTSFDSGADGSPPPVRAAEEAREQTVELLEQGRQQGLAEARAEIAGTLASNLASMTSALQSLHADREAVIASMSDNAVAIALQLVRKIVPGLSARHGLGEIEELVRTAMPDLLDEPRVVVRVHDSLLDALREHIDPVAADGGFEGDFVLLADPGVAVGDCRIEWADGGVERDTKRLWQEIEEAVSRHFGDPGTAGEATQRQPADASETGENDV